MRPGVQLELSCQVSHKRFTPNALCRPAGLCCDKSQKRLLACPVLCSVWCCNEQPPLNC